MLRPTCDICKCALRPIHNKGQVVYVCPVAQAETYRDELGQLRRKPDACHESIRIYRLPGHTGQPAA